MQIILFESLVLVCDGQRKIGLLTFPAEDSVFSIDRRGVTFLRHATNKLFNISAGSTLSKDWMDSLGGSSFQNVTILQRVKFPGKAPDNTSKKTRLRQDPKIVHRLSALGLASR
jgi:hypothetical protein